MSFFKKITQGIADDFKEKGQKALDTSKDRMNRNVKNDDFSNMIEIETDIVNAAKVGNLKAAKKTYFQKYYYDENKIIYNDGIVSSKQTSIPFIKIKTVTSTQTILQKQVNIGEVIVTLKDGKEYIFQAVVSPHKVSETLNTIVLSKIDNVSVTEVEHTFNK